MHYIYVFYFDEIPVYAGLTNNPVQRYKFHYSWAQGSTYNYLRHKAVVENKMADMRLVYCCADRNEAARLESIAIIALINHGFIVLNRSELWINRYEFDTYPEVDRLPRGLVESQTPKILKGIERINKEYEHRKPNRYNAVDHSTSFGESIRYARAKNTQLGK